MVVLGLHVVEVHVHQRRSHRTRLHEDDKEGGGQPANHEAIVVVGSWWWVVGGWWLVVSGWYARGKWRFDRPL